MLLYYKNMTYTITKYTKDKARLEGVKVKVSTKKGKKIDVFDKKGNKLASIGGIKPDGTPYMDYPNYIKTIGKEKADLKRSNYLKRHSKEAKKKDGIKTPSYFADVLLW